MIAHLTTTQGTALWCDTQGVVQEILRDDLGWMGELMPGQAFTLAIHRSGFQQALDLLAELYAQHVAQARALPVSLDGEVVELSFSGLAADGDLLIVATRVASEQDVLLADLMAGSEEMGRWRGALAMSQRVRRDRAHPDSWFYEEFSRLSNELSALQREMARKNAALERAEATLKGYAGELEKQVAERTAALRASEGRFRAIFQRAALGIALLSLEGSLLEGNPALWRIIGDTYESQVGRCLLDEIVHPEDRSTVMALHGQLVAGERDDYEVESRLVGRPGQTIWAMLTCSLVRNRQNAPSYAVCLIEDTTTEKQARAALMQAEKLALAGRLAAALTHEIGNPLQSVIGLVGMFDEAMAQKRDVSRYVQLSLSELSRMRRTLSSLRNLYRTPIVPAPEPTHVETLLEQVLALTEARCAAHEVRVIRRQEADLPMLSAVPDQITQVFLNVVLNAIDAMPDGGVLDVSAARTAMPPGLSVTFSDHGVGIAAEALPHVFEPFYTTKPEGMGLGLYISQDIVRGHGGHIQVESQVGHGTRFTIWLPAQGSPAENPGG